MVKITIKRKTYEVISVVGWEDVKNDISEQKFIEEFAKMFVENKPERGKPDTVDTLAV